MTDREIIQALECCKNDFSNSNCLDCPYNKEKSAKCITFMIEDAIALITRQQAEIERLSNSAKQWEETAKDLLLSKEKAKSEAIKEFWSRLQGIAYQSEREWSHGEHPMVIELDDAEEIYIEMVGEQK